MSHGAETGLPHINRYPGNAVPLATRPEMELTSVSEQGTRVNLLAYQEEKGPSAALKLNASLLNATEKHMVKNVIKVSEAREILAAGGCIGVPHVQTNREGSMIYYTADPAEMTLWRASQNGSVRDGGTVNGN